MHLTKGQAIEYLLTAPSTESVTDKQIASLYEQISTILHKLDGLESTLSLVLMSEEQGLQTSPSSPARTGLETRLVDLSSRLESVDTRIVNLRERILL